MACPSLLFEPKIKESANRDSAGRLSRKDNPNGTYEVYAYDTRNRVTSIVTKDSSNAVLQSRVYTFDLASQVCKVIEGNIETSYSYDDIGQLTGESKVDLVNETTVYAAGYTYDANGNRLSRTVNSVTESYSYDSADKLTAITGGSDSRTFTYDAAGRTTGIVRSSGTTAFSYDYESRVTSITKPGMITNSFSYNGLDTRVGLTDSSGTKTFKRAGVGVTAPVLSDGTANFTPSGEKRGTTKTTFHSALKNSDIQTNSSGAVSASKQFDAFGNEISGTGTWKSQFGYAGGFGYQQDSDTGLKLLGHRYYDSDTGRFLTRDPIKDGRNWYNYCSGNPVTGADPEGYWAYDRWLITGDGDAEDEAYEAGLNQAWHSLGNWWDHFKDRNRKFWPALLAAVAAVEYPLMSDEKTGHEKKISPYREKTFRLRRWQQRAGNTFGRQSLPYKILRGAANGVKKDIVRRGATRVGASYAFVAVLYVEAGLAIGAGHDTMNDDLETMPIEYDTPYSK